ncbi:MAG: Nif3-like dinuclear metal center hexameric protein [bacterium]
MEVSDFKKYVYNLKGRLNPDEGLLFGNENNGITGIQVSWMASLDAIESAQRVGANLMLVHEALFYPYPFSNNPRPKDYLCWSVNKKRKELLSRYEIAVIRFHGTLDEICILDDFAKALGLPEPSIEDKLVKLYDIEPVSIETMIKRVKKALLLDIVRVTPCDLKKKARRIGLPWGGLGLFVNVSYQERLLKYEPDLFIAGESDCYGFIYAIDAGIPMIETSHEISENIGLKNFADKLKKDIMDINITFYENKKPWINL